MSAADIQLRARYRAQSAAIDAALNSVNSIINVIGDPSVLAGFNEYETRDDLLAETSTDIQIAITRNFETGDGVVSTWVKTADPILAAEAAFGTDVWASTGIPGAYFLRIYSRLPSTS